MLPMIFGIRWKVIVLNMLSAIEHRLKVVGLRLGLG